MGVLKIRKFRAPGSGAKFRAPPRFFSESEQVGKSRIMGNGNDRKEIWEFSIGSDISTEPLKRKFSKDCGSKVYPLNFFREIPKLIHFRNLTIMQFFSNEIGQARKIYLSRKTLAKQGQSNSERYQKTPLNRCPRFPKFHKLTKLSTHLYCRSQLHIVLPKSVKS